MADMAIENAIKSLKQRRDEIESGIRALESLNGGSGRATQPTSVTKKSGGRRRKPMSAAIRAKLRAAYATRHPGWKPKKR